jgi:hypothetical protein
MKDVAHMIAKGPPPDWLAPGLAHFHEHFLSKFVSIDNEGEIEQRMLSCAKYLEQHLPMYIYLSEDPYNFDYLDYVDTALISLYEVIQLLEKDIASIPTRAGGPKPDLRRPLCAAVCAEAYRIIHGDVEPYSLQLQQACEAYWVACGNSETGAWGEPKNWIRYLELARARSNNEWIVAHITARK